MWKIKLQKLVRNLLHRLRRLYMHEWNDHLEIFSCPQVIENSSQHLFLLTDILQKKVVRCPCFSVLNFKYLTWKNPTIITGNVGCFIHVGWTRVMCLPNNSHLLRTVEIPIPILALICSWSVCEKSKESQYGKSSQTARLQTSTESHCWWFKNYHNLWNKRKNEM